MNAGLGVCAATLSEITAGSSSTPNVTVRSNPCGPVMRSRKPPLNGFIGHRREGLRDGRVLGAGVLVVAGPEVDLAASLERYGAVPINFSLKYPAAALR